MLDALEDVGTPTDGTPTDARYAYMRGWKKKGKHTGTQGNPRPINAGSYSLTRALAICRIGMAETVNHHSGPNAFPNAYSHRTRGRLVRLLAGSPILPR